MAYHDYRAARRTSGGWRWLSGVPYTFEAIGVRTRAVSALPGSAGRVAVRSALIKDINRPWLD